MTNEPDISFEDAVAVHLQARAEYQDATAALKALNETAPKLARAYESYRDLWVAQEATCLICGHVGLECRQFHAEDIYRAFAVCPRCGVNEEI